MEFKSSDAQEPIKITKNPISSCKSLIMATPIKVLKITPKNIMQTDATRILKMSLLYIKPS